MATTPAPVTVILPTHNHPRTLPYSIDSVLAQTFTDFRLIVICDGAAEETLDVVADAARSDPRVEVVTRPKSARTGEEYRAEVLADLESSVVSYHGDDDLLLPDHLEQMCDLLAGHDFAHPLPIYVGASGDLVHIPTDISEREWVDWHLSPEGGNTVSLTGATHTLEAYRRLPHGWRSTPDGTPTDLYMWQQFFALPEFRGVTGSRSTTVKLDSGVRKGVSADARASEIQNWARRLNQPGFAEYWEVEVNKAVVAQARDLALDRLRTAQELARLRQNSEDLERRLQASEAVAAKRRRASRKAKKEIAEMRATLSWRVTAPLRRGRR